MNESLAPLISTDDDTVPVREVKGPAPQAPGVFAPIHLGKVNVVPHEYILHIRSQHCRNCGTLSHSSQFFALNLMKTRTGEGKPVKNLTPVHSPEYNLPVKRLPIKTEMVPFCHECASISLAHLPSPPKAEALTPPDLIQRNAKPAAKKEKKIPSLDDLA
jgi:hypothetical protein